MAWFTFGVVVCLALYGHWRLKAVAREMRRMSLVHHEAANRAMRRYGRDRWRFREIDAWARHVSYLVDPSLDVPDIEAGPPDDPDSG